MSYRVTERCADEKKVLGEGLTLKEAYDLVKKLLKEDGKNLTASYEDLEEAINTFLGIACVYTFWGCYEIKDEQE